LQYFRTVFIFIRPNIYAVICRMRVPIYVTLSLNSQNAEFSASIFVFLDDVFGQEENFLMG